jgi:hypothetical protein
MRAISRRFRGKGNGQHSVVVERGVGCTARYLQLEGSGSRWKKQAAEMGERRAREGIKFYPGVPGYGHDFHHRRTAGNVI